MRETLDVRRPLSVFGVTFSLLADIRHIPREGSRTRLSRRAFKIKFRLTASDNGYTNWITILS
jgi:hypothetical protein